VQTYEQEHSGTKAVGLRRVTAREIFGHEQASFESPTPHFARAPEAVAGGSTSRGETESRHSPLPAACSELVRRFNGKSLDTAHRTQLRLLLRDNGAPEFHYNYLDYFWRVDGTEIRARHYLRRSGMRAVAVMLPLTEFDQPKYTGILQYLQRRFAIIETFEPERYVMRWMVE
jgi:hypothetical protein